MSPPVNEKSGGGRLPTKYISKGQRDYEMPVEKRVALSDPLKLPFSRRVATNRIMKAALTERLASWDLDDVDMRGVPSQELAQLYNSWSKGKFGIIITGNIMIDNINLEAAGNMTIPPNELFQGGRFSAFQRIANQAKQHGSLLLGQLNHPGRQVKSIIQPAPVSASDVALGVNELKISASRPHPASKAEIEGFVNGFAHAAEYLEEAGFDGVQIHAAHGYLLGQFLSLNTNKRTDEYGTDKMENRARLICDIASEIRRRTRPDFILSIKINSVEFEENGFQPADAAELCLLLEKARFDLIELSGGTYKEMGFIHKRQSTQRREAFFMDFAETIVKVDRQALIFVTGGFRSVDAMTDALKTVDGVGLGRPVTQEPFFGCDVLDHGLPRAAKQACEQDNFGMTAMICSTQMRQIAECEKIMDARRPDIVEAFAKGLKIWLEAKAKDEKMKMYKPMKFPTADHIEGVGSHI